MRGKYYRQAVAGTNLVLIEPDLADVFPDTGAVNRALRFLVDTAEAAVGSSSKRATPHKRLQRTAAKQEARAKPRAYAGGGR